MGDRICLNTRSCHADKIHIDFRDCVDCSHQVLAHRVPGGHLTGRAPAPRHKRQMMFRCCKSYNRAYNRAVCIRTRALPAFCTTSKKFQNLRARRRQAIPAHASRLHSFVNFPSLALRWTRQRMKNTSLESISQASEGTPVLTCSQGALEGQYACDRGVGRSTDTSSLV